MVFYGGEGVPGVSCRFWSSGDNHSSPPRSPHLPWVSHTARPNCRASSAPLGIVTVYSPFPKATRNVLSRRSTGVQPCSELNCQVQELLVQKERSSNITAAFQKLLFLDAASEPTQPKWWHRLMDCRAPKLCQVIPQNPVSSAKLSGSSGHRHSHMSVEAQLQVWIHPA